MTDELKFPNPFERRIARDADSLDERNARVIHDAYLPPVAEGAAEDAYWSALESKIMARINSASTVIHEQGWLSVLNGWAEIGLVAATALFAIGGFVSTHYGEPDEVSYDSIVQSSAPEAISAPATLITTSDQASQRDAALQYVLSY